MHPLALVGQSRPPLTDSMQITGDGRVLRYLHDPKGEVIAFTTSVTEGPEGLYIGSFVVDYVGFLPYANLSAPFVDQ